MKATRINNSYNKTNFKASLPSRKIQDAAGKYFSRFEQIGEGANIALDFIGKAALVPAIIMTTSKEEKEKKTYSAIKNPIGATIQLILEVPLLMLGSKYIEKVANEGKLDAENSDFSYNEKGATDTFLKTAQETAEKNEEFKNATKDFLEKVKDKGFSNAIKDDFDDIVAKFDEDKIKNVVSSFKNMEISHRRLYHLQNRLCFAAALILTPVICGFENFLHPRVMNLISKPKKEGEAGKTKETEQKENTENKAEQKEASKDIETKEIEKLDEEEVINKNLAGQL